MTTHAQNIIAAIVFSTVVFASPADAAGGLTASAVKNLKARVPSMGEGPGDWIQFRNGEGVQTEAIPYAKIKSVVVGATNNLPLAVTHIEWNTGGSGYWNTLILFKEKKGKIAQVGTFCDYIGSTDKLQIKQNRIFVHLSNKEDFGGFPKSQGVKKEGKGWISLAPSAFTP